MLSYAPPPPPSPLSSDLRPLHSFFSWEVRIPFPRWTAGNGGGIGGCARVMASSSSEKQQRGYRSVRRRTPLRKARSKEKELELNVSRCIVEDLPDDPEILIMAIGDGEYDVEMLNLASFGIALSNGSEKAKAVANVIGISDDEDGAADVIYQHAF